MRWGYNKGYRDGFADCKKEWDYDEGGPDERTERGGKALEELSRSEMAARQVILRKEKS